MIMDRSSSGLHRSTDGIGFNEDSVSDLPSQGLTNRGLKLQEPILDQKDIDILPISPRPSCNNSASWPCADVEEDPHEDYDFGDVALKYVSQMLMDEGIEERTCMWKESLALEATEKLYYDIIGEKYPPPVDHQPAPCIEENCGNPYKNASIDCSTHSSNAISDGNRVEPGLNCDVGEYKSPHIATLPTSHSFFSSSSSANRVPNIFNDSECVLPFRRGFEEASKFPLNSNGLLVDLANPDSGLLVPEVKEGPNNVVDKMEKRYADEYFRDGWRGKKNSHPGELELEEERSNKQAAVCNEVTLTSEMFDQVLLRDAEKSEAALREYWQNETSKTLQQDGQPKGSGKSHGRKKGGEKDLVDWRSLLTLCAQAVAADDWMSANRQLKQIRQHASPMGDGMQRMAHYFANALEARLAGSGPQMYKAIITKPSAANFLKVYHLLLAVSPFLKVINFFSNKIIAKAAEKAGKLHIIEFGVLYGFAWPSLIQRLSSRPGGPPKLRITGIDLPQPGFRPAERVEETGRLLANYAKNFNVPFEYNALVQKFETVQIKDLKIDNDEILVVMSRCRFRNLHDETVVAKSPRNTVLNLIRKMNPRIFLHAIVNAAGNSPFFMPRFREALFHFSALFEMLEENVPRNILERMLVERESYGREIMNIIACEGFERIERPETYKQWQVRNERAGFKQLPLDQELVKAAKERVKSCYHKHFMIDEDGQWLRQGWKGRIIHAMSSWEPAY